MQFLYLIPCLTNRDIRFSPLLLPNSNSIRWVAKNVPFSPVGLNSFHGSITRWCIRCSCFLFCKSQFNNEFVSKPFRNWKYATGTCTSGGSLNHDTLPESHKQCVEQAASFLAIMIKAQKSVRSQLSQAYDNQIRLNTRALTVIIHSIQFLVKQGLALRSGNWNKADKSEHGNFTSLLEFMEKHSPDLKPISKPLPEMHGTMHSTCNPKFKMNLS